MAKLSARGRTELFRMQASFVTEKREAIYAFLSDGAVLYKVRAFGSAWSQWRKFGMRQTQAEKHLAGLGYIKTEQK